MSPGRLWYALYDHRKIVFAEAAKKNGQSNTSDEPNKDEQLANVSDAFCIANLRSSLMGGQYLPRFRRDTMKAGNLLGKGAYGIVWRTTFNDVEYAMKQIKSNDRAHEIWKERDMLIQVKGPRIVNLVGAFHDGDAFLVMELCFCKLCRHF